MLGRDRSNASANGPICLSLSACSVDAGSPDAPFGDHLHTVARHVPQPCHRSIKIAVITSHPYADV